MDPYKRLQLARKNGRPSGRYYIEHLLTDFIELHGDRRFGDDPAIMAGIGFLCGRPVTVIAHEKGEIFGTRHTGISAPPIRRDTERHCVR